MDRMMKALCDRGFKSDFHTKKEAEFQKWFERIAKHAYGDNFQIIIPAGSIGDRKCDGKRLDTHTIFQCFAPKIPGQGKFISKIKKDFEGAKKHWGDWMKEWIFVHNLEGLYPDVSKLIDRLNEENKGIVQIMHWSKHELEILKNSLSPEDQLKLFGEEFTMEDFMKIKIPDLVPIIKKLHKVEINTIDSPISVPSMKKLEKNKLSTTAQEIIKIGRIKSSLVAKFFDESPNTTIGEQIAESIRKKYSSLKQQDLEPEKIFWEIDKIISSCGESEMAGAKFAVLTHFFDTCDILENPSETENEDDSTN